jgi:tRNA G18 (ribose-2'-O)-methylase SpoU
LKKLQIEKFQIISLSEKSTNRLNRMDFKSHVVFIFGNENKGIEEEIFQISDLQVRIPMTGQVSSLNVSNSCSIVLYERTRQLIE